MRTVLLRTLFVFVLLSLGAAGLALPALGQSGNQNISATVAVQSIAITLSPTSVDYGTLQFGTTKSSGQLSPAVSFTVTNTGNVDVGVRAYGADALDSEGNTLWSLIAGAVNCAPGGTGKDSFAHSVTPTSDNEERFLGTSTSGSILTSSLAPNATLTFTSKIYMPCLGSAGVGQTANTTITVFALGS